MIDSKQELPPLDVTEEDWDTARHVGRTQFVTPIQAEIACRERRLLSLLREREELTSALKHAHTLIEDGAEIRAKTLIGRVLDKLASSEVAPEESTQPSPAFCNWETATVGIDESDFEAPKGEGSE